MNTTLKIAKQPSVATISSTGVTTSRTQGTTTLTATLSTFSGSANLSVSAPTLVSAVISPGSAFLPPGTSQQLTVLGSYSDGRSQNITSSASWGSSASNVATVSSSGLGHGSQHWHSGNLGLRQRPHVPSQYQRYRSRPAGHHSFGFSDAERCRLE